ncbi:MAG: cytidine deaminase [Saccharofermentans sp.]|nr:cytidine deaminase [Saccharofermentans sp.]
MDKTTELCKAAIGMRSKSYAPYSNFRVGAAILTPDGRIFTGCNIENSAFGPSICAERCAVAKAVSEGCKDFEAIAIAGGRSGAELDYCPPCGVCRQVLSEFADKDLKVILVKSETDFKAYTLGELLPLSFGAEDMGV